MYQGVLAWKLRRTKFLIRVMASNLFDIGFPAKFIQGCNFRIDSCFFFILFFFFCQQLTMMRQKGNVTEIITRAITKTIAIAITIT